MTSFITVASNYTDVYSALNKEHEIVEIVQVNKHDASKKLIVLIKELLANNSLKLTDLSFIGANQGPGPFTTLRTVLATVNGISFASGISLVGINSLEALLQEYADQSFPITVVLLNAFGNDVYYFLSSQKISGCNNINTVLAELNNLYPNQPTRFLGNGVRLHEQTIKNMFGELAIIPSPLPEHASVQQIATMAFQQWQQQKDLTHQLLPIYLKEQKLFTK